MEGEVLIEWRRPASSRSPERAVAFRAVLEDLRSRLEERGIGVTVTETLLSGDAAGQVLMNGIPLEDLVPMQGRQEGCSGCAACATGAAWPVYEEVPAPLLRLAALRASGISR